MATAQTVQGANTLCAGGGCISFQPTQAQKTCKKYELHERQALYRLDIDMDRKENCPEEQDSLKVKRYIKKTQATNLSECHTYRK